MIQNGRRIEFLMDLLKSLKCACIQQNRSVAETREFRDNKTFFITIFLIPKIPFQQSMMCMKIKQLPKNKIKQRTILKNSPKNSHVFFFFFFGVNTWWYNLKPCI